SRGWSFGQGHCKAHGPESYGYQGLPKGSVRPITLGTGSFVASTMEGQAPWAHYSLNTQHSSLRHSLYVISAIGDNIHHRSIFNVAIEGIRVRPLQIPPVFNIVACHLRTCASMVFTVARWVVNTETSYVPGGNG